MKQRALYGLTVNDAGLVRTPGQIQLETLRDLDKAAPAQNIFTPSTRQFANAWARYEKKAYYVTAQVSGGAGTASDLMASLPSSETVGVMNLNAKKIADNEVLVVERIELDYATAASSVTTDTNTLVPTLSFSPAVNDAPVGIKNGEIELTLKDARIVRLPVVLLSEPVEGSQSARSNGISLNTFPCIQSGEVVGVKLYTAGVLPDARHFVRFCFIGDAMRPKV